MWWWWLGVLAFFFFIASSKTDEGWWRTPTLLRDDEKYEGMTEETMNTYVSLSLQQPSKFLLGGV
jgi:hypothetical protein